jgi:hypothetical protein
MFNLHFLTDCQILNDAATLGNFYIYFSALGSKFPAVTLWISPNCNMELKFQPVFVYWGECTAFTLKCRFPFPVTRALLCLSFGCCEFMIDVNEQVIKPVNLIIPLFRNGKRLKWRKQTRLHSFLDLLKSKAKYSIIPEAHTRDVQIRCDWSLRWIIFMWWRLIFLE